MVISRTRPRSPLRRLSVHNLRTPKHGAIGTGAAIAWAEAWPTARHNQELHPAGYNTSDQAAQARIGRGGDEPDYQDVDRTHLNAKYAYLETVPCTQNHSGSQRYRVP